MLPGPCGGHLLLYTPTAVTWPLWWSSFIVHTHWCYLALVVVIFYCTHPLVLPDLVVVIFCCTHPLVLPGPCGGHLLLYTHTGVTWPLWWSSFIVHAHWCYLTLLWSSFIVHTHWCYLTMWWSSFIVHTHWCYLTMWWSSLCFPCLGSILS